jgi:hypothetical protein
MEYGTAGPGKWSIARQRPINMFTWQSNTPPAISIIPRPWLGNSSLKTSLSSGGIFGIGVLFWSLPRLYNEDKQDMVERENIRGLNLVVVKLMTVQVTKLPL